jgi:hypothetical protein
LYGIVNLTLRKLDQEYLESFEVWCWRRMEKINLADRMRDEEVEEKGTFFIQENKGRLTKLVTSANRKCLLNNVCEGTVEDLKSCWIAVRKRKDTVI